MIPCLMEDRIQRILERKSAEPEFVLQIFILFIVRITWVFRYRLDLSFDLFYAGGVSSIQLIEHVQSGL